MEGTNNEKLEVCLTKNSIVWLDGELTEAQFNELVEIVGLMLDKEEWGW